MRIRRASTSFSLLVCLFSSTASIAHADDGRPTAWTPWQGHHYRLEADGQFACLSEDGKHCSIAAPGTVKAVPLRCDSLRKGTGSAGPTYEGNGHRLMLSTTPRGDRMCLSEDGTQCLPGSPTPGAALNPLVCGRPMKKTQVFGSIHAPTDPRHWCQSDRVLFSSARPALSADVMGGFRRCSATLATPGWRRNDAIDWIVRLRPGVRFAASSVSQTTLTVSGGDWSAQAEVAHGGGGLVSVAGASRELLVEAPEEIVPDSEGRVSIGIRQDDSARIHYFGATGWPDSLFHPEAELVKPEEVIRRGARMVRPPSPGADEGQLTVDYLIDGDRDCDDQVFERIDMIRRQPRP